MVEGGNYENPWLYEGKPFTTDDINDFFGTSTVLSIYKMGENTSVGNISGSLELPKVRREK